VRVEILRECGYEEALLGLSLSYNREVSEMSQVAEELYCRDDSESKFLRFIVVWLDITAPRFWWCQMDTYCVGKVQQSESTMHTIMKRVITANDFSKNIPIQTLNRLNVLIKDGLFEQVKAELPEGFLQRRIVATNYQVLRRIIKQRKKHRLPEWQEFITAILDQIEHREFFADLG